MANHFDDILTRRDEILLGSNFAPRDGATDIALIPTASAKQVASAIVTLCIMTILTNIGVCYTIYKKRSLRNSSTAIIIGNLACVDVLVTIKDVPMLMTVVGTGRWYFESGWCGNYGLTNVIYIIVSVSTLVTVTTERYCRLKEKALQQVSSTDSQQNSALPSKPSMLGYVIAHTTLSYSLSLLWSKYTFLSRKAFCRIEWPPRQGMSLTFMTSIIFIFPVSLLIYNALYGSFFQQKGKQDQKENPTESKREVEQKAKYSPKVLLEEPQNDYKVHFFGPLPTSKEDRNGNNKDTVIDTKPNESQSPPSYAESNAESTVETSAELMTEVEKLEYQAHSQLQLSVGLFLLSWTPYVVESMVSGYRDVPPTVGFFTALIPILATSLLPLLYLNSMRDDTRVKVITKDELSEKLAVITGV